MSHDNIIIVLALINIQLLIATSTIIYNYLSGSVILFYFRKRIKTTSFNYP
ncbi:hypothetical protein RhiirB3_461530 [Rhizophagus irregularis]|nr:hypothetical protein RhiirB3_461530 [Rhizophagus irregularis]